jgi:hypothetical protein
MGAIATFSFPLFAARYPEFAGLDPALAASYFSEATLYLRNDGTGPVQDAGQQLVLLNMLTAHIAHLNALNPDGSSNSGIVGPITSAAEGSVSVTAGLAVGSAVEAWYAQSQYGLTFWTATAAYRSFRYVPSRRAYGYGGFGWR